ncbi:hypothetical protein [Amycolatopsis taiwanensis]|uniref:Uncharacterized protein n=1 Tax=Amycolatopsis taiwanensis TaxID=342230 RepID=A0A9W6R6I4_9PSEU|nr:hypothetical protein [Amycolatopsis taiwanensis]GLY68507.1 hypothetical protein Atai01_51260 [Amycolatopsis taiwanensis]
MDNNAYVTFLVVGVILVAIDGQIIYHNGKRYLNKGDEAAGDSMAGLITVLFHLVVLGVLALISTIDFPGGSSLPAVIGRLGVLLLVLGLAHGVTIAVFNRRREEQVVEDVHTRVNARLDGRQVTAAVDSPIQQSTVDPVPGQEGVRPRTSPSIEHQAPYTTE